VGYGGPVASTEVRGGTKARVLDAALASFGTAGFAGTSLDDLASGLGIRKQTILYHFVSKRGLLNAVVDSVAADLILALEQVLAGSQRDWERVEALVRSVFRVALEQPVLLGLLREVSRPNSPGAQRLRGHMDPLMARARLWIEAEMAAGRMRRTDAQQIQQDIDNQLAADLMQEEKLNDMAETFKTAQERDEALYEEDEELMSIMTEIESAAVMDASVEEAALLKEQAPSQRESAPADLENPMKE